MNDKNTMMDLLQTVSPVQKDNIKLSCDIVSILVSSLKKQLENTIIDNDALKMSVEALREKRKQELIDAYKVDDEERELQKQLKKLGLDNWADILTGEDDIVSEDVKQSNNVQSVVKDEYEEEKDYVYATYQGENADDDEVEEDYVSYESYDY
jgi:regulator of replication initiation timing